MILGHSVDTALVTAALGVTLVDAGTIRFKPPLSFFLFVIIFFLDI